MLDIKLQNKEQLVENILPCKRTCSVFKRAFTVELFKLIKRKDTLLLFVGIVIPLFYSIGFALHSNLLYVNSNLKSSAASFMAMQCITSSMTCIFHLIAGLYTARCYSTEIENGSILLYVPRLQNRYAQYRAKLLSLFTVVILSQIIIMAVTMLCYYLILVPTRPDLVSGLLGGPTIVGATTALLLAGILSYLTSIIIVMSLNSYIKMIPSFVAFAGIIFVWQFIQNIPVLQFISPFYYITQIGNLAEGQLTKLPLLVLLFACILCFVFYVIIFTLLGIKKFKKRDLA